MKKTRFTEEQMVNLAGDRADRRPLGRVLGAVLLHEADRALADFRGIPTRLSTAAHGRILSRNSPLQIAGTIQCSLTGNTA
jgi:hypothetical protein